MCSDIGLNRKLMIESYKTVENLVHRPNTSQITGVGRVKGIDIFMDIEAEYFLGIHLHVGGTTSQQTDENGNKSNQNQVIFFVPFQG